ncbi:peflin [Anaeramoeba flamelloides]|uniref:Peflin n=1 Tax=Anaeramoeba flamelloides TaxID=1746091 RepID=A0AAV8AJE2_9EUKA|nr:peflin [Anaeramoeba flamelloides]
MEKKKKQILIGLFNKYDTTNRGSISEEQLFNLLNKHGYEFSKSTVENIIGYHTTSDTINLKTFLEINDTLVNCHYLFMSADSKNRHKEYVTHNELFKAFKAGNFDFSKKNFKVIYDLVDDNNDNKCQFEEFVYLYLLISGVKLIFTIEDQDESGTLNIDEFLNFMPKLGIRIRKNEARKIFNQMDSNNDGQFSLTEVITLIMKLQNMDY